MATRRMKTAGVLELAIERERGANKFYREAAEENRDQNAKNMFHWLAKEELRHLAKLRQQLKSVLSTSRFQKWKRRTAPIDREEFPSVSEAKGTITADASEMDALRQAIQSEKDAISFYKEAENNTLDLNGKNMFMALSREEEGHLELLEEELKWLTQSRKYFTLHRFELRID